uniref:Pirin N-terminal domain-containing protein n=1 Tax=Mycena chlorophos TaxID=658473 RepID=A0ABQ0L8J1_MYCCL|nr:predicted protein [Mycena chlorophos]
MGHKRAAFLVVLLSIATYFTLRTTMSTSQQLSRSVTKKVLSIETPEGAGALVRRSIGTASLRNLTPFLMLDHFHVSKGAGFPDHPHRGQSTITYMLEGSSRHEDSAGHKGTIETGGVQWMVAGRGIIHAEMPVHAPAFQELPQGWTAFIYVLKGSLTVGTDATPLHAFHTLVLSANSTEAGVLLKSLSPDTQLMLAAAEPINEPIVQHGPFVMNTQEEIMQTFQDYRQGKNGFEKAHVWKSEIGGL